MHVTHLKSLTASSKLFNASSKAFNMASASSIIRGRVSGGLLPRFQASLWSTQERSWVRSISEFCLSLTALPLGSMPVRPFAIPSPISLMAQSSMSRRVPTVSLSSPAMPLAISLAMSWPSSFMTASPPSLNAVLAAPPALVTRLATFCTFSASAWRAFSDLVQWAIRLMTPSHCTSRRATSLALLRHLGSASSKLSWTSPMADSRSMRASSHLWVSSSTTSGCSSQKSFSFFSSFLGGASFFLPLIML